MTEQTTFMKISYPSEFENPFWDSYFAEKEQIDQALFMNKLQNNLFVGMDNPIGSPGVISFTASTNTLDWTTDFIIPIFHFGYKLTVPYGPTGSRSATILDGYAIVVNIPFTMTANTVISMQVLSQLTPLNHQQWIMAWRSGTKVYFKGMSPVAG
jgi:hypothetical protein